MADILALIDQLITEHKMIGEKTQSYENAVNDSRLMSDIDRAQNTVVPGEIDQTGKVESLNGQLVSITSMIEKHFSHEESSLLKALEEYGDVKLTKAFNRFLSEHTNLRNLINTSKKRLDELVTGDWNRIAWDTHALEILTSLNYARSVFETHAAGEEKLFSEIRRKIKVTH